MLLLEISTIFKSEQVKIVDTDHDGVPDHIDGDADGNGIPDYLEKDSDGDGIPDYIDEDDDNDGIPDIEDDDDDGDGIPDWMEESLRKLDSDGDGKKSLISCLPVCNNKCNDRGVSLCLW